MRHYPVYTVTLDDNLNNLLLSQDKIRELGVDVVKVKRGGNITFHGPGQLMIYSLWKLDNLNLHSVVQKLEEVGINIFKNYGVDVFRLEGYPGLWTYGSKIRKIASVGIAGKKMVTYHGIALNITEDSQEYFKWIKSCGLHNIEMTSLKKEVGLKPDWEELEEFVVKNLIDITGWNFTFKVQSESCKYC